MSLVVGGNCSVFAIGLTLLDQVQSRAPTENRHRPFRGRLSRIVSGMILIENLNRGELMANDLGRTTLDDLRARREEIVRIAAARGAHNIRVFGSVARGEENSASDIDFLVDLDPHRTLFDLSELILDLQETLGRKVDVVEIRRPSRVGEKIQRQAVPL